jgi:hypothetical protein
MQTTNVIGMPVCQQDEIDLPKRNTEAVHAVHEVLYMTWRTGIDQDGRSSTQQKTVVDPDRDAMKLK